MDGLLFFVQFIFLQSRALTTRKIPWCILEDEKSKFYIQFSSDLFCLMGDFNGYVGVTPEVLMLPHACTDEAALEVWDDLVIHLPPRVSKDHSRRKNNWGRKILDFCCKENFVILNGRVGNDGGVGNFTCFSGTSPSVINYILVDIPLWHICADFEVMAVEGSDHLPVTATFELVSSKKLGINSDRRKNAEKLRI